MSKYLHLGWKRLGKKQFKASDTETGHVYRITNLGSVSILEMDQMDEDGTMYWKQIGKASTVRDCTRLL